MRLLLIEDEKKTAAYLAEGLRTSGFIVHSAYDGQEGLFLAQEHAFDLIILDVMLPKIEGWTVITELRKQNPEIRVIFLTARDALHDKVKGFKLGADDYLVKPFAFSELLARVNALLRRRVGPQKNIISIADLHIDLIRHKVSRQNQLISLTAQEFNLLIFLAEHVGEVLSRTLIAEQVWDIHFNTDTNVVDVAIKRLRQKIDSAFDKKLIHTIRGVGYVLEAS